MNQNKLIKEAKRRFEKELERNPRLNLGRTVVPALPNNHYAVFFNGRFQTLEKGSGDYYEGY